MLLPMRYAGLGPSRQLCPYRIPSARQLGQLVSLRRFYASEDDNVKQLFKSGLALSSLFSSILL